MDLKLRYSDSMAMTKLMRYVSAGQFEPAISSFVVPVKKKREESGRRRRRKKVEDDEVGLFVIIAVKITCINVVKWDLISAQRVKPNIILELPNLQFV